MTAIRSFLYADGGHSPLSNFYPSPLTYQGESWATVEHAYQAAKTLDTEWREKIRTAPTPGEAKRLGRQCPLMRTWEEVKIPTMRVLLSLKFAPGSSLADYLLSTEYALLVEGNTWGDRFWGEVDGKGANWLGWLLMAQRAYLRSFA